MTANSRIIAAQRENVLRVPLQALRYSPQQVVETPAGAELPHGAGHLLWGLLAGKLYSVPITAGLDDGTLVEVSGGGLQAGDQVVINETRSGVRKNDSGSRALFPRF
jgi:HlyD family secretion protein